MERRAGRGDACAAYSAVARPESLLATDLPNRLHTSLGDTYRTERELAGGGMARVHLAVERGERVLELLADAKPRSEAFTP